MAPPSYISARAPLASFAREYLDHVLRGARADSTRVVMAVRDEGRSLGEIYQHIFTPVLYEVGRLWQINEATVLQEWFCSAMTQSLMATLSRAAFSTPRGGFTFVGAAASGNLHDIGLRMICDLLEEQGWDTRLLSGAMTPGQLLHGLAHERADVLGLSASRDEDLASVARVIAAVRRDPLVCGTKIIVGGFACRDADVGLKGRLGADCIASSPLPLHDIWTLVGRSGR